MPNYRLTNFYQIDENGFTEQFYLSSTETNPKRVYDSLGASLFNTAILYLRTQGTILQATRISNVDTPRSFWLQPQNKTSLAPLVAAWDESPDLAATSALVKLSADNGKSRRIWIRALSDSQTIRNRAGTSDPPSVIRNRIQAYIDAISGNHLSIRSAQPNVTPYNYVAAAAFAPNVGNKHWTDIGVTLPAQPAGVTRVQIRGVDQHQLPGLRGSFPIVSNGNGVVTIPYAMPEGSLAKVFSGAAVRWQGWVYSIITEGVFERFSTRKTGRVPFGVSRGRSKAVLSRK